MKKLTLTQRHYREPRTLVVAGKPKEIPMKITIRRLVLFVNRAGALR